MTPERWARLKELFAAAIERPPEERDALVAEVAAADPGLAQSLAELLAEDAGVPTDGGDRADRAAPPPPLAPAERIGRYRIVAELGHGGMGTVYRAERADGAFRQQVALKVVSGGRLHGEVTHRRFLAERQILAHLTHPSIARLIDGGTTPDGQPYLVLELVDGVPIDQHCRERGLDTEAVLRLFLRVCEAIEAAHHQLVVHRDLKPSNVLVTAAGDPKLLDFGIAKLLDPGLAGELAVETRYGSVPMTPRYASPEQVRGEPVTVATDVYSLGVVLYELLTDRSPYGADTATPAELAIAICRREPRSPSTALTTRASGGPAGRRLQRARRKSLAGDLDAIVLKALRKDAAERYASVAALADDVRRHLDGHPVAARRGSRRYRFGKFVRRNRWPLAAAALFLLLVGGFAVDRALQVRRIAAERDKALEVTRFLVDLFRLSDPSQAQGESFTVREALDRGAARIDRELAGQPAVQATLLEAVGRVYYNLGLYDRSKPLLGRALALQRTAGTASERASALLHLAQVEQVQGNLAAADRDYREARALAAAAGDAGGTIDVLTNLAQLDLDQAKNEEARDLLRDAFERMRANPATPPLDLAENRAQSALAHLILGDNAPVPGEVAASLAYLERDPGSDPVRRGELLGELGIAQRALGANRQAAALVERGIAELRRVLPGDHAELANLINSRGLIAYDRNDLPGAIRDFEESAAMWRRLMGDEHARTALALANIGNLHLRRGDYAAAEAELRRAVAIDRKVLPPGHEYLVSDLEELANAVFAQGRSEEAAALLDQAAEALGTRPANDLRLAHLALLRARERAELGDAAGAEALARPAVAVVRKGAPPGSADVAAALLLEGHLQLALGHAQDALPLLEAAARNRHDALGAEHFEAARADSELAAALLALGRVERARPLLDKALAVQRAALAPTHPDLAATRERLAQAQLAAGDAAAARATIEEALAALAAPGPANDSLQRELRRQLATLEPPR